MRWKGEIFFKGKPFFRQLGNTDWYPLPFECHIRSSGEFPGYKCIEVGVSAAGSESANEKCVGNNREIWEQLTHLLVM